MRIPSTFLLVTLFATVACGSDDPEGTEAEPTSGGTGGSSSGTGGSSGGTGGSSGGTGGSSGGTGGSSGGNGGETTSLLEEDAVKELRNRGADQYRGEAVINDTSTTGEVVKVSFDPDSGPICFEGDPFALFYVDRGSDSTMFVLDGGGACWSSLCAASATVEDAYAPAGIAAGSADNYFGDWNVVFVPYCDGSVFSGDNDFTLPDGTVRYHRGRRNLTAAFDVALEQFGASERVMVAGFSAGGYGTISGMIAARLMYPQADLFIVNDSGPGVQNPEQAASTEERIAEWQFNKAIPMSCTECGDGRGQLTQLYAWMMERDANVKVSVLSYFGDAVIGTAFNALSAADYETLLRTETGKVQEAYPERFKRFMLPGTAHVVSAGWGSVTADGVLVDDWVSAMVTEDDSVWVDILASGS